MYTPKPWARWQGGGDRVSVRCQTTVPGSHNIEFRKDALVQEEALQGNPVARTSLEALRPESFSSILILADNTEYWQRLTDQGATDNMADADSRCLASLLLLRDIQSSRMHYGNTRQSSGPPHPIIDFTSGRTYEGGQLSECRWVVFVLLGLLRGIPTDVQF